ncbi:MAG: ABC transporter ATP-binding protein [Sandaracinaceae bacterium]|nr:ABC transporter ATP-binding protein [Sandaracinaceae bacterium]MDW8247072.1 ABC transporter ATP-binding protein [Sandaracinaceae bacterium]
MASKTTNQSNEVHIAVRNLRKSYDGVEVLRGIELDIYRGKINIIIGGSGAGKSVFSRQLIRLEQPDSGQILVDGIDIVPLSEWQLIPIRRKFGMVFQFGALFDSMTVYENVAFPLHEHTRMSRKEIHERVMDRLAALNVAHAASKLPAEISGGMQKRVAIARALVLEPEILIYDEPTSGLDPITSRMVDDLIAETAERFGVTSVVITHDMASVFRIGHWVSMLHKGRIEESTTPDRLRSTSNPIVSQFLKASGILD